MISKKLIINDENIKKNIHDIRFIIDLKNSGFTLWDNYIEYAFKNYYGSALKIILNLSKNIFKYQIALGGACAGGKIQNIKMLLSMGATIDTYILKKACEYKDSTVIDLLFRKYYYLDDPIDLFKKACTCNIEVVKSVYSQIYDIYIEDSGIGLIEAYKGGDKDIIEFVELICIKADIELCTKYKIIGAIRGNHINCLLELIKKYGMYNFALKYAGERNYTNIIEALINYSKDWNYALQIDDYMPNDNIKKVVLQDVEKVYNVWMK